MPSASLREADEGFAARLAGDGAFQALVGTDENGDTKLYEGWPRELLESPHEGEFPRATYLRVNRALERPGSGDVRLQLDLWTWGDSVLVDQMEERVIELVDEKWWFHNGARLNALVLPGGADFAGTPWRRSVDVEIGVS